MLFDMALITNVTQLLFKHVGITHIRWRQPTEKYFMSYHNRTFVSRTETTGNNLGQT